MFIYLKTMTCNLTEAKTESYENEANLFAEPFNELWKKMLGTAAYIYHSFGGMIMLVMVHYERQGLTSNYRTVLNQLNSWILLVVCLNFYRYLPS